MAKRIYTETVKKWLIASGITVPSIVVGIFVYLSFLGIITPTGSSTDSTCSGLLDDPCYAYMNFTVNEDVFIYPVNYDPWGRDTPFDFEPGLKDWTLQRSWGTGWRTIPLDDTCKGTWCGGKYGVSDNVYSVAFREGREYQIRIVAYKVNPLKDIKWSAFDDIFDPIWYGVDANTLTTYDCDERVKYYNETIKVYETVTYDKTVIVPCDMKDAILNKSSKTEECYIVKEDGGSYNSFDKYDVVLRNKTECIEGTERLTYIGKQLNYGKEQKACTIYKEHIGCDDCEDGNCNGVYEPGETYYVYNLTSTMALTKVNNGVKDISNKYIKPELVLNTVPIITEIR